MLESDKINIIDIINFALRENLLLARTNIELAIKELSEDRVDSIELIVTHQKLIDEISNIINLDLISLTTEIYNLPAFKTAN